MKKYLISLLIICSALMNTGYADTLTAPQNKQKLIENAQEGIAEAQFNLAILYQSEKKFAEAAKWYRLSAEQGFTKAQINLALLYQQGKGVTKDSKQMLYWMQKSADAGDPLGQMNMAEYTLEGIDKNLIKNKQQAQKWLEKAAAQHFQPAELMLAYWYEKGVAITEDPQKSQQIYLSLAKKNNPQALYLLGYQAATGMYDNVNYQQAYQYFSRSAQLAFSPAQNSLGMLYLHGQGVKKDVPSAIKWLTLASEQGEISAQFNLALIYARGDGVPADQAKACRWFIKAAQHGNPDAQYASGACYQYGMGVTQDDQKALYWYKLAASQRHDRAEKKVLILENNIKK
ncbi:tetratricopeptide repeat protein [Providencia burhodogranariea]|uniref:tetratricopeptide repeat protein n=1 Tax=Providencia burhodogranariea TaxID=516074 RepID=UPI00030EA069|nr:tetratricopeptide repeat protein [Providencia burhodogranariea]